MLKARGIKMHRILFAAFLLVSISVLTGCQSGPSKTLTQISSIDALLAGSYDGQFACGRLLSCGDTGIGTFDKLDGEMILLDGKCYQAKADGTVVAVAKDIKIPFAAAVFFTSEKKVDIRQPMSMEEFKKTADAMQKNQNLFTALKAKGLFKSIKVRSVPAQSKPYKPLVEVTKKQTEFIFKEISGTLVGFKCPPFVKGVNVPGYHIHFISDDFKSGGHVLSFEMSDGFLETAAYSEFFMMLPDRDEAFSNADTASDRTAELEKAEK